MNQKRLWISTAIIALVIGTSFLLSVPHTTRDVAPASKKVVANPTPVVAIRDTYKKGKHTLSGSLVAPNACATASTTASLAGDASSTPHIAVTIALSLGQGICLQVPTALTFSLTLSAPASLPIGVTVNGVVASTTAL